MRADLGAFFDDANIQFGAGFPRQLLEADRSRQAGRSRPDDHHIELH